MKKTINVAPTYDLYDVKEKFQNFLKEDIRANVTTITIRLNKHWEWSLSGLTLIEWATEIGLAIEVHFPQRKDHIVYVVRRVTGEDDIQKDKLLKELGV